MLLITIFLMSSLVVGCGKKNVNTVSTKEDALVEETEESEKIEQETEIVQTENEEKKNLGTFVLYFSGIDVWGWTDTKSRSDVNIIAAVNTETRHVQLINTPRDYFVEMPISNGQRTSLHMLDYMVLRIRLEHLKSCMMLILIIILELIFLDLKLLLIHWVA